MKTKDLERNVKSVKEKRQNVKNVRLPLNSFTPSRRLSGTLFHWLQKKRRRLGKVRKAKNMNRMKAVRWMVHVLKEMIG